MIRIKLSLIFLFAFIAIDGQEISIPKNDTIAKVGEIPVRNDSINPTNSNSNQLTDVVDYVSDEQYFDVKNEKTYLISDAVVKYLDMEIQADYIEVDLKSGDIYAVGKQDSTGRILEPSIFKQGQRTLEYGSFTYNINTKKGKAFNVRTEESIGSDKGVVVAGVVKQYNDSISGMRKIAYTTDTYYIERKDSIADYHLEAEVGKLIKGKENKVVTGPIIMKIYDIPTPLALPFAFLPTGSKRSAGILLPSFGEREELGFYLQGLGVYVPIGEYLDLAFTGDFYTKGSYGFHALSNYRVKYKFNGNFNFDWEKNVRGIKGLDSYDKSTNYRLAWSHRQDIKANPNLTFNANVNLRSSKFYQNGVSNLGISSGDYLSNNVNSSINLNKNWPNTPFSASLSLNHSQNVSSRTDDFGSVYLQLPSLTLAMNRVFPFAPKNGVKKGILQSLGVTYNMDLQNKFNTTEDRFLKKEMWDDARTGAQHRINLNTGTTVFNYFPLSFGANYQEVWTLNSIRKFYDSDADEIITEDVNGFKSYRTFGMSTSLQTVLYGTKVFGSADDDKKIKAIRHMMSPSISFNYRPDFGTDNWGYFDSFINAAGEEETYSYFDGGIYSSPGKGLQQSISFGLNNNVEIKVRDRESKEGVKKIKLLESLNISTGYNFAAEQFKWSNININGRTSMFQRKLSVAFSANIDPYQYVFTEENPNGKRIDKLGNFRLSNYSFRTGYRFSPEMFGTREMNYPTRGAIRYEDFYFDEMNYAKFLTPWSLNTDLTHRVSTDASGKSNSTTTLALNGSISPTPHWAFSGRTSIDLNNFGLGGTYFTFSRDLRSFILDFSMNPFGQYKTWNFFIGIKANFLRDALKYEERNFRTFNNNF